MPDQTSIATVLQCHKCQKRLKYTGKKPSITCPGCGESLPVADNIQEDEPVVLPPPIQPMLKSISNRQVNYTVELGKWEMKARQSIARIKKMPRFPVVLSGIWIVWFAFGLFLFVIGMINFYESVGSGVTTRGGAYYSNAAWFALNLGDSIFISTRTAFLAIVGSVIAYFWLKPQL